MLKPEQVFAHFKIIRELGEGGMGEVYLAEDQKLDRRVALKTLRGDYFDNQDHRERFAREAKTAAQISHPNVMAIYDIGAAPEPESGKTVNYIVMEYVKGTPLGDYVQASAVDTGALLRLAEKIASGLAAAHRMNIVHRDIKAENIMIDEQGEPKILDFGLAKPIEPVQLGERPVSGETVKKELTKAGTVVGTVSYMSPEQARGETVDTRSDVFSFGVLLYKMFTGDFPFTGATPVSILAKILESPHASPRLKFEDFDPEIERVIDKCLQKDPNDRYQDTRDLVVDLRNIRRRYDSGVSGTTSSVTAQIDSAIKAERKKQRVRRLIRVGAILLIILPLLFWRGSSVIKKLISGETSSTRSPEVYTLAVLGFENKTGNEELDWLKTGLPEILLTDLSQSQSINVVSQRRISEVLGGDGKDLSQFSYKDQVNAARKLGAVNVLSGSIFKFGDKIRIDARLEDVATGKIILGEKVVSSDPITLVDSLANRMAAALNMREMAITDRGAVQLTTASPEAYKYYHLGLQKFLDELYDDAITDFQRALAIDSTFALPYMRIGMSYVFMGRQQEGVPYFAKAQEYESRLPARDRSLLDVYADIWLNQNFDRALTKMGTLVAKFPNDEESKSVYALLRWQLVRDTVGAVKLLREVLETDPKYQLALTFMVAVYQDLRDYDKAIGYAEQMRQYHPDSPAAYGKLAGLYVRKSDFDGAIKAYEEALTRHPDNSEARIDLSNCYIRKRDFGRADLEIEALRIGHENDPFRMEEYYRSKANLANWLGEFRTSLGYRFNGLSQAYQTEDSARITQSLQLISFYYEVFGFHDSAVFYAKETQNWAALMQRLNYPVLLVTLDRKLADSLRPMLREVLADFRARVPAPFQVVGNIIERYFEAYAAADTAAVIENLEALIRTGAASSDAKREAGELCVLSGRYQKGKESLEPFVSGADQTTSGYSYPYTNYLLGIASEGLGKTSDAIKYYQEMLRYWDKPQIEIAPIKDAKARLAKLRG